MTQDQPPKSVTRTSLICPCSQLDAPRSQFRSPRLSKFLSVILTLLITVMLAAYIPARAVEYQIKQITNHGHNTSLQYINNRGEIVYGGYNDLSSKDVYLYKNNYVNKIISTDYYLSPCIHINDNGDIVWNEYGNLFIKRNGNIFTITRHYAAYESSLNNNGQVVFVKHDLQDDNKFHYSLHIYDNGSIKTIVNDTLEVIRAVDINNKGQVVFITSDGRGLQVFLYKDDTIINLSNYNYETAELYGAISVKINNNGHVVWGDSSPSGTKIVLWKEGTTTNIIGPETQGLSTVTFNDIGQVVWLKFNEAGDFSTAAIYLHNTTNSNGVPKLITYSYCFYPAINNLGQIVWTTSPYSNSNIDIYLATPQAEVPKKIYGLFIGADQSVPDQPGVTFMAGKGAEILSNKFHNLPNFATDPILLTKKMDDGGNKKREVKLAIEDLKKYKLKEGDGLILYINCHGFELKLESSPPTYVYGLSIGSDRDINIDIINEFPNDYITDIDLKEILSDMDNIKKWVFIDSCHAGGFYNSISSLKNACLIASTTADELAYGHDELIPNEVMGLFTTALDVALTRKKNGKLMMDSNDDDTVTFYEVLEYIQDYNQKTDWVGSIVYELSFGNPFIFTLNMWTPTGFRTPDFVGGLNGNRKIKMAPILGLLLD